VSKLIFQGAFVTFCRGFSFELTPMHCYNAQTPHQQ
jgi:hypothetical protein